MPTGEMKDIGETRSTATTVVVVGSEVMNELKRKVSQLSVTSGGDENPETTTGNDPRRVSSEDMDVQRQRAEAYEYLCHLEEIRVWIGRVIGDDFLPPATELEECLRNGVYLAKLAHVIDPRRVPEKTIFDKNQSRYKSRGLHFKHTDNINHWVDVTRNNCPGFPAEIIPETLDVYEKKNMPKVIFCLHAFAMHLFKNGLAPMIEDLVGRVSWPEVSILGIAKELSKYGLEMPAFGKIGGVLATDLRVDEAAHHAAIIAVNESLDGPDPEVVVDALMRPAASLKEVNPTLGQHYHLVLVRAKAEKMEGILNRSTQLNVTLDAYDEYLTGAEIQGFIRRVNQEEALIRLREAIHDEDELALAEILVDNKLGVKDLVLTNVGAYLEEAVKKDIDVNMDKNRIQTLINDVNCRVVLRETREKHLALINDAIRHRKYDVIMSCVNHASISLPSIQERAVNLYGERLLKLSVDNKHADLSYEQLDKELTTINKIVAINDAVIDGDKCRLESLLSQEVLGLRMVDETGYLTQRYLEAMFKLKCAKESVTPDEPYLTHEDIQDCLDNARETAKLEEEALEFASSVNFAVDSGNDQSLMFAFQSSGGRISIGAEMIKEDDAPLYLSMLENAECRKGAGSVDLLRIDDIQYVVGRARRLSVVADDTFEITRRVDQALENDDFEEFVHCLDGMKPSLIENVTRDYARDYFKALKQSKELKKRSGDSTWVCNVFKETDVRQYVNVDTRDKCWEMPFDFNPSKSAVLSNVDLQTTINQINTAKSRLQLLASFEPIIIQFQARCRGAASRQAVASHLRNRKRAASRIQRWWREILLRKRKHRMRNFQRNVRHIIVIQRWWRKMASKISFRHRQPFYDEHATAIVKIQAWFRGCKVRRDYHIILKAKPKLDIRVLRKFIHLLDNNGGDFQEEIEMQRVQHEIIKLIKFNAQLEKGLDEMDVKIGLLIRNRISLQDVVNQNKKISRARDVDKRSFPGGSFQDVVSRKNAGLKDLNADSRRKLEAYQHLFYLLQTNPSYLAKLIFEMPQNRSTKFMESVILTLYGYGSSSREEYLLMKLFETALDQEVAQVNSVGKMVDVLNGNPLVVKMIISYARRASSAPPSSTEERRKSSLSDPVQPEIVLKEVLGGVVMETLTDPLLKIETNPVDIYKRWINSNESETGRPLNLPYNVSMEKALEYEAVREKLNKSIESLVAFVAKFLDVIVASYDRLPYVIRYAAAILKNRLSKKFPEAPAKAILKVVGNLLYYRYMNPAIVAPDSFNIVDLPTNKCLTTDQRRNLGSIAKILQLIASKKGFGKESPHLQPLNGFIMESHEKMKKFFDAVCRVDDPECHFNINRFHDACLLTKPSILIPAQEVIDSHQLLLEYEDAVSSDDADPIHEVLEELGEVASLEELLGVDKIESGVDTEEAKRTEILLTVSSKESFEDESKKSSARNLFIRTKHMIIDLIRSQPGDSLQAILQTPASSKEETIHRRTVTRKMRHFRDSTTKWNEGLLSPNAAILKERTAPLDRIKPRVVLNLRQLERIGLTSGKDGYETLIREISDDVKHHHQHRKLRHAETKRLKSTLDVLKAKTTFLHEQADFYDRYIESCLDNLNGPRRKNWRHSSGFLRSGFAASIRRSRRSHPQFASSRKAAAGKENQVPKTSTQQQQQQQQVVKPKGPCRFTGKELQVKGILISIHGLAESEWKDVLFEFKATELTGVFDVTAKYMGVVLESLEISIQNLLQLQYENVNVVSMCDRVEVNVNLLVFLLNKRFFGK